eukprot:COSAG02_NODE_33977_length_491_cov_1.015306_1_plen_31_part_10
MDIERRRDHHHTTQYTVLVREACGSLQPHEP